MLLCTCRSGEGDQDVYGGGAFRGNHSRHISRDHGEFSLLIVSVVVVCTCVCHWATISIRADAILLQLGELHVYTLTCVQMRVSSSPPQLNGVAPARQLSIHSVVSSSSVN